MHKFITNEKVKEIVRSRQKRCTIIRASYNTEVVHNQLINGIAACKLYDNGV